MLQTQDRHRLRSVPPQPADHNSGAESELPHRIVRHLTTVRDDTTKVIPLFANHNGTPTIADPAGHDSRSARALRGWLVQSLLLEAIMRDETGDVTAAEHALERALELAEPDRVLLPFTVDPVPPLLKRHARSRSTHTTLIAEIFSLLTRRRSAPPPSDSEALLDPLTDGEERVLRYLPTNLSKREIADELYVSVATVKTHMHHLYAKLDVHSRAEAVNRARALGLLEPSMRA
jgi:LuxR family transcriptional regulator, maltose regulon positive regulatory protein